MISGFDQAKYEYENEDENGKIRLIYAYFGLAVYYCQCLEESFSIMLCSNRIFNLKIKTQKEVNKIIDSIEQSKKITMGIFIKEVKENYNLSANLTNDLKKILDTRNYLVHKYFKQEIHKMYSDSGRVEMIKYFCDFIDKTVKTDTKLKSCYSVYTKKMNITDDLIHQMMDNKINQEKKSNSGFL